MQQQIPLSGNTYIQFSFEKSLRKYEKQPHKKIKPNSHYLNSSNNSHCVNNNHSSSVCRHCVQKMRKKNSVQSNERLVKLQNSRKNETMRSRNLARQFSQTKKKRQMESSAKRQSSAKRDSSAKQTSSIDNIQYSNRQQKNTRRNYHQPLSEFKLDQQINISIERDNVEQKLHQLLDIENGLSERMFTENDKENVDGHDCFSYEGFQGQQRIIQEQPDESFCHIEISQGCKNSNISLENSQINDQNAQAENKQLNNEQNISNQTDPKTLYIQYPQMSYAYFSSCSSLDSCQSDESQHQQSPNHEPHQLSLTDNTHQQTNPSDNPFLILKLESKEELKKERRNEYRERVFYKIKKFNDVEQVLSECESISQNIHQQLSQILQNNANNQLKQQNQPLVPQQTISLIQNNQPNSNKSIPHEQIPNDQQFQNDHSLNQPFSLSNQQSFQQQQPQNNPQLKRDRKTFNTPYQYSTKRKATKINFQIEQNYQCLGRIKISGLGQQKQSICLSIRRFSHQSSKHNIHANRNNSIQIDKSKMVDYLISQRPYLSKSRQQLINLLSQIIDSQQGNSVAKRLFQ